MVSKKNFSPLFLTLALVFLSMLGLMFMYELVKQALFPTLTLWESHTITILFTSAVAVLILYFPLRTAYLERQHAREALQNQVEAEEKLRRSEMQYRSFVESVEDSLYTVDPDLNYLLINTRHLIRRGISPGIYVGKNYRDFHTMDETRKFRALVDEVVRSRTFVQDEYGQNGRHFQRKLNPVVDPVNHEVAAVTVISSDITDRMRIEKNLLETNRKLSLVNDITRHDILNQLSVLSSLLSLAGERAGDPEVKNYILRGGQVIDTIHAQILFARDYQTIGADSPKWQNVRAAAARAGQCLNIPLLEIDPSCSGIEILADPLLVKVFYNLMENSLRYGASPLRFRVSCATAGNALLVLCEDNGPGIPAPDKKKIFLRGYGKNTGLGLFLIREILLITGITICETGIAGEGARFEIRIPPGSHRPATDP